MNKLALFYKDLLKIVGVEADDNGELFVIINGAKKPVELDGKIMYLPTDENVNTRTQIIDGKPAVVKALFNPLEEDEIKGSNNSFNKFKSMLELKLMGIVSQLGVELLSIILRKDDINDMELTKFVNTLNVIKSKEKVLIDDKSIKQWVQIYSEMLKSGRYRYVKFFIKKGGVLENIKYNRIGTITFPFIDELNKASEKKEPLFGVKLRRKDFNVYTAIMRYLFKHFEPNGINQYGSLNRKSPSLHILLLMYNSIYERLSDIIEIISNLGVDEDIKEMIQMPKLPIKVEAFGEYIDDLENEMRRVPNDTAPVTAKPKVIKQVNAGSNTTVTTNKGSFWDKFGGNTQQQQTAPVTGPQQPMVNPAPTVMGPPPVVESQSIFDRRPAINPAVNPVPYGGVPPVASNPFNRVPDDPWAPPGGGMPPMMGRGPTQSTGVPW